MSSAKRWLLPDGVEEILPEEARKLESLRREILDLYRGWGYELVITPLIEFLDSLLVGSSHDLDLHTFKLIDQLSGQTMGIRADITPQAARIDAHRLNRNGPVRLCYADNVLHTLPRGIRTSRAPIRIGAEFYGHAGVECDIEVICLMCAMLKQAGVENVHLVLGHVGIYRSLLEEAGMDPESEKILFDAVQRKAYGEVDRLLAAGVDDGALREMLKRLVRLSGGEEALEQAQAAFSGAPAPVKAELEELLAIDEGVRKRVPAVPLSYDLCELRGYQYHTGIVFAAYTPGYGRAVAKGGRYDNIGEVFGRARPATGFDSDLKTLARLTGRKFHRQPGILAPDSDCAELRAKVEHLRASGEIVICDVSGACDAAAARELDCDRLLLSRGGEWVVEKI